MFHSGLAFVSDHAAAPVGLEAGNDAESEISGGWARPETKPKRGAQACNRAGAGEAGTAVDVRLAQLMCARVCHDLIGAAGAIESGIELLGEDAGDIADIHDLIGLSGRQLNRRLAFYRLAFGFTGGAVEAGARTGHGETGSLADARRVTAGLIEKSRVALHWNGGDIPPICHGGQCRATVVRLLLCSVLIATDALFRGGELRVSIARGKNDDRFSVAATARGARVAEPIVDALAADARFDAITARTVHAYYLGRLVHRLGARLDLTQTADGFSLSVSVPTRG